MRPVQGGWQVSGAGSFIPQNPRARRKAVQHNPGTRIRRSFLHYILSRAGIDKIAG
jgi:hypothetical protein